MTSLTTFLSRNPRVILVTVASAKGSTPREQGAFMLVSAAECFGTIGGGQLEFMAIDNARACLDGSGQTQMDVPLGPEIGQCCGGRTLLTFNHVTPQLAADLESRLAAESATNPRVMLFGAGHVGKALAAVLTPLPLQVTVVETRAEELLGLPDTVTARHVAMPEALIKDLPAASAVIILTHDHALDFLIAKEALARNDLAYVGMIGSSTKRATFKSWLAKEAEGAISSEKLVLPIGGTTVRDKRPAVIAALVAAELLETYARRTTGRGL